MAATTALLRLMALEFSQVRTGRALGMATSSSQHTEVATVALAGWSEARTGQRERQVSRLLGLSTTSPNSSEISNGKAIPHSCSGESIFPSWQLVSTWGGVGGREGSPADLCYVTCASSRDSLRCADVDIMG